MKRVFLAALACLMLAGPVAAQWQVPDHAIPIGRGSGIGFKSAAPISGGILSSTSSSADPSFSATLPSQMGVLPTGASVLRNFATWAAADPFIEDFGGGVGVADNTAAFNAAVTAGHGVRFRDCFDKGTYHFTTAPNTIGKTFRVSGCNDNQDAYTFVSRDYTEATATRGLFHWTTGQPYVMGLFFQAGSGTGGTPISIIPDVAGTGGPGAINHVRVSVTSGTWSYSLYVDGSNLTSPIGVRTLYLNDVTLFGASVRAAFLKSVVHFDWFGGSISQAGGVDGGLEITGTASAPSSAITIDLAFLSNDLTLDRVSGANIRIAEIDTTGTITNTANTSGIVGSGIILGTAPQSNWTNSSWLSGGTMYVPSGLALSNSVYPVTNNVGTVGTSVFGWSALYLAGSTSGIAQLKAPAVAGSAVWTGPSSNTTLVGRDTTDTLTNKTLVAPALGAATATSINGVSLDNNAWSTYTPTLSSSGGSLATTGTTASATGRYKQIGKTIHLEIYATCTTVGTASGQWIATLPVSAAAFNYAGVAKESALTGRSGAAQILGGSDAANVRGIDYNGTTFWASGGSVNFGITYEAQ